MDPVIRHSALVAAVLSLAVPALPGVARGESREQFCAPLATTRATAELLIAPESRFPEWGRVPIGAGKGRLVLGARYAGSGLPQTVRVGSPVAYPLFLQGGERRAIRLRWTLEVRVSRLADPKRTVRSMQRRIGLIRAERARRVRLPAVGSPGAYLYDLTIRDRSGKVKRRLQIGRAVLRHAVAVRLATFGDTFRVGDTVAARIENYGSESVRYGAGAEYDRLENGVWVRQSFEAVFGHPNAVPAIGLRTNGGFAGGCRFMGFTVPAGMTPGRYRIVKEVEAGREPLPLHAEFNVVP